MTNLENQQFIFGSIFLLANKLQLLGDKVTEELTVKQWFLLKMIHDGGHKAPNFMEIAKAIGTTRQNVSKMIGVLEKKGMVTLQRSEEDQRAIYVSLTEQSLNYFLTRENAGNLLLDKLFSDIAPKESENVVKLLGKMLMNCERAIKEEEL